MLFYGNTFFILVLFLIIVVIFIYSVGIFQKLRYRNLSLARLRDHQEKILARDRFKYKHQIFDYKIVVSLTTIPDRIGYINQVLNSVLTNSILPDKVILNLPYTSQSGQEYIIPEFLSVYEETFQLYNTQLILNRVETDLGPATKSLPTLYKYWNDPKVLILVIDDDILYAPRTFEYLLTDHIQTNRYLNKQQRYDLAATTHRFQSYDVVKKRIHPVKSRYHEKGFVNILMGYGCYVLVPTMFDKRVFDYKEAPECARYVDDIWISCWLKLMGVKIHTPRYQIGTSPYINTVHDKTPRLSASVNASGKNEIETIKWFQDKHGLKFMEKYL